MLVPQSRLLGTLGWSHDRMRRHQRLGIFPRPFVVVDETPLFASEDIDRWQLAGGRRFCDRAESARKARDEAQRRGEAAMFVVAGRPLHDGYELADENK